MEGRRHDLIVIQIACFQPLLGRYVFESLNKSTQGLITLSLVPTSVLVRTIAVPSPGGQPVEIGSEDTVCSPAVNNCHQLIRKVGPSVNDPRDQMCMLFASC